MGRGKYYDDVMETDDFDLSKKREGRRRADSTFWRHLSLQSTV